ncbi:major capsid protein [Klebsiella pneumoniae]|uniref:major capsid protein n=1 Tax=Klebsiella pneumoniae TaxID=573 RepID=UPI0020769BD5|nr:phage capsid protein [Klebsiella pneumoniae]MDP1242354.1 phage capsid protein [Klebsiella pneumoniae]USI18183.1 phage capsid protein [Klebsiella pneumoniae]HBR6693673.1 phage capsid protein [Klebsiella pneumoniae]HCA9555144.1 phage capsid protein [Klebsiella pneumoniae]HCA9808006.1 phage capsid protein [Klebsiella pneumoniae]
MALIGQTLPSLLDVYSRTDKNGRIAKIVEQLAKSNDVITDAIYVPCNDGSKHKTTIRAGIPEPVWRRYNQGVQPTKTQTVPVTDTTGMLYDLGFVDKDLADRSGNADSFRVSENMGKLQGFNNKVSRYTFYGNTDAEPEAFMGLAPRFNTLSTSKAASAENVFSAGGSGSTNTSIWFMSWGENTAHMIYPEGMVAGFQHQDLGNDLVSDANGGQFLAYRDEFKWHLGLSVRDWRSISRICNIDVTTLTKDAATGADLISMMVDAYYARDVAMLGDGKEVIYCNKTIHAWLHKQAMNAKNVNLTIEEYAGKKIVSFLGIPIRRADAILNTESAVTA